ncbi:hypothetical protein MTO96_043484 [Rhipicephalus appendiculatus]
MSPTAAVHRCISEDGGERYPGMEHPVNATSGYSSHDHASVLWYDSVNYSSGGVAGEFWSANRAPRTPRQSPTAFATRDTEGCVRTLRGHFTPLFGADRFFGRRTFFPVHELVSRLPKWFIFGETCGGSPGVVRSSRPGCERAHYHAYLQGGSEISGVALKIADRRGHAEPEYSSSSRNRRRSYSSFTRIQRASLDGIVVSLARRRRRSAHGSPRP